ncbi:MAG: metallophosphoesterase [Clostridia bacterium]|nr:metallophosphoesterase [Clostridia bacterium]
MNDINTLRLILHVSDFHLTDNNEELEHAKKALKSLTEKLKSEKIKIDYLVHTGDIINSSDIFDIVANELHIDDMYFTTEEGEPRRFNKKLFAQEADEEIKHKFDDAVKTIVERRFDVAAEIMRKFISDLNIPFGSVVICCGNHDVLRPFVIDKSISCKKENDKWMYGYPETLLMNFMPFENFLNQLGVANSQSRCAQTEPVSICTLDNLNFLILNTNWQNPKKQKEGYYCINCERVRDSITKLYEDLDSQDYINIVLAHKPIYEICEKTRLAYKRYIKTPFMSDIQKFTGENGLYFCGDKHTRSIIASQIHDIPHYFSGEPLNISHDKTEDVSEVEYNLIEIFKNKIGMERKIHLKYNKENTWTCEIRPQDAVVSKLYKLSKKHIVKNAFETIAGPKNFDSWENLCQEIYGWKMGEMNDWVSNLNNLFL